LSSAPTPELTLTPTLVNTETPLPTLTYTPTFTPTFTEIPSPTFTLIPSLTPTETLIPTETFTPFPTATEIRPAGPLTIDYTYDALHRLKSAMYSDGRSFNYVYDVNGNTLEASDQSTTTTYTYDAANQLVTAQSEDATWNYVYDGNGSLIKVLPNGSESNGAKRYTYNAAGYLVKVEAHDENSWNVQAEMNYDGMGARLTTSANGIISYYALDGQLPLTVSTDNKVITILYGREPIAEKTDEWNYVLTDGVNLPRQLTDDNGLTTLSVRYNPWGKPIEIHGTGNFDASFIGTLIDATTGLIYIGHGQYYDPETGRFLTRGMNPNGTNPYVPWNPIGGIVAPFTLASVYQSYNKKKNRVIWFVLLALTLATFACAMPCSCTGTCSKTDSTPTDTPSTGGGTAGPATTPTNTPAPTDTPTPTVVEPTCTDCTPAGRYYISAYYIVGEDQYSDAGGIVPVPASGNAKTTLLGQQKGSYWYLSKGGPKSGISGYVLGGTGDELKARYNFLYHGLGRGLGYTEDKGGICVQGTGKLLDERGGHYIFCPQSLDYIAPGTNMEEAGVGFEWQPNEMLQRVMGHEFDTIAACVNDPLWSASSPKTIVIPDLKNYMATHSDSDNNGPTTFTVRDNGQGLCTKGDPEPYNDYNTLDLFVGAGKFALDNHATPLINMFPKPAFVEVYLKP
jgi:YD repeat-containing protein